MKQHDYKPGDLLKYYMNSFSHFEAGVIKIKYCVVMKVNVDSGFVRWFADEKHPAFDQFVSWDSPYGKFERIA